MATQDLIKKSPPKYLKYKKKYFKLKQRLRQIQTGGSICNIINQTTYIFVHGACLDGAMTAYLLVSYCGVDTNKIKYIAPGEYMVTQLSKNKEENPTTTFGLYDLALPERDLDLQKLGVINMIDHHISSAKFKDKYKDLVTYNDQYATCGILWATLRNDPQLQSAPFYLQVINRGDRGLLSLENNTVDDFSTYIGLQYILDQFAVSKKNVYTEVPYLINYLINTRSLTGQSILLSTFIKYVGIYEIINRCHEIYQYSDTCYTDKIGPGSEFTCIYLPKSRFVTTMAQVAGKTLQTVDFVIVYPDEPQTPEPRLTIRGISSRSNANELAKFINPADAGGHIKAASVGVTLEYIDNIKTKIGIMKLNCLELATDTRTNYLPAFTPSQREYFMEAFGKQEQPGKQIQSGTMRSYIFSIAKLIKGTTRIGDKTRIGSPFDFEPNIEHNFNLILNLEKSIKDFTQDFDKYIQSIIQNITSSSIIPQEAVQEPLKEPPKTTAPPAPIKKSTLSPSAIPFKPPYQPLMPFSQNIPSRYPPGSLSDYPVGYPQGYSTGYPQGYSTGYPQGYSAGYPYIPYGYPPVYSSAPPIPPTPHSQMVYYPPPTQSPTRQPPMKKTEHTS